MDKANNKIIANNTKNTGFKIYRYILKFLMAFSQKNHAITKDEAKINKYKVICFGDKNGENAISNDVVASLGKAKNGPITRYKAIVKM